MVLGEFLFHKFPSKLESVFISTNSDNYKVISRYRFTAVEAQGKSNCGGPYQ
jgi:hypothetical protein